MNPENIIHNKVTVFPYNDVILPWKHVSLNMFSHLKADETFDNKKSGLNAAIHGKDFPSQICHSFFSV